MNDLGYSPVGRLKMCPPLMSSQKDDPWSEIE